MTMKHLVLGALAVGCLSLGASYADGTKPALTDEQKAKIEELKAKMEAQREAMKGKHDSLSAERKAEIEKRMAERKAAMEKAKAEMDALRAKAKALVDEYKEKLKAASDSDKAVLAKELAEKLKALGLGAAKDWRARFDGDHEHHDGDMASHRDEIGKKLAGHRADFAARRKEIEARRAEWLKNHPDDSGHTMPRPTPEQIAEMKAKFEEWQKAHQVPAAP
jgi:hypothetical protein